MTEPAKPKLRIDKWLWYARVLKTRSLATKSVQAGHIRVNREKVSSASFGVKVDDVLTIAVHNQVRILKVKELGTRRGPAPEAATLFDDLTPPPVKQDEPSIETSPSPERRPSKRERRQIGAFKSTLQ